MLNALYSDHFNDLPDSALEHNRNSDSEDDEDDYEEDSTENTANLTPALPIPLTPPPEDLTFGTFEEGWAYLLSFNRDRG